MRSERELREAVARIKADARYGGEVALVQVNAPLALIQVEMKAQVHALRWALGESEVLGTSAASLSPRQKPRPGARPGFHDGRLDQAEAAGRTLPAPQPRGFQGGSQ